MIKEEGPGRWSPAGLFDCEIYLFIYFNPSHGKPWCFFAKCCSLCVFGKLFHVTVWEKYHRSDKMPFRHTLAVRSGGLVLIEGEDYVAAADDLQPDESLQRAGGEIQSRSSSGLQESTTNPKRASWSQDVMKHTKPAHLRPGPFPRLRPSPAGGIKRALEAQSPEAKEEEISHRRQFGV